GLKLLKRISLDIKGGKQRIGVAAPYRVRGSHNLLWQLLMRNLPGRLNRRDNSRRCVRIKDIITSKKLDDCISVLGQSPVLFSGIDKKKILRSCGEVSKMQIYGRAIENVHTERVR
ncbi:hypothetical protein OS493_039417, partial [Desmophyllum pertusum]